MVWAPCHITASTSSLPSVSVPPLAFSQRPLVHFFPLSALARFNYVIYLSVTSQRFVIVDIADRASHRAGADKKLGQKMINVASGDRNAIWPPQCRDALMASQQGRGKALSRWQCDKWRRDGCKDCRQDKEKEKSHGRRKKTKKTKTRMTTKWDLINLDFAPPLLTNSAQKKKRKGNCFWGMRFPPSPASPPFPTIPLSTRVEKAKGRMGSDNAPAPVE